MYVPARTVDLENMEALESDGLGGEICGNAPTSPQPHVLPTPTKTGQGRADSKRTSAFARARMSRNATNTEGPQPATRAANVMAEVVERDIVAASAPVEPPQFRRSPYPIAQKRTPVCV
ncbi:hypothetical protein SARC_15604 [Sphaeroforma arctica JP610]|uniref:Uncharacterized protein n=1 Tax=Sphaeroforma arctica JP610 TaxID=667725 RepID=A0A0L0F6S2_9EUKA|nr:hypothetical protein SARC_15604 [Sphaeroforma arctica JP610]KNC71853.1 hypothetical protein SARC_15604 [Sphaeroforma arctica JP610]|eukprot:XP_014145755.1 hypothetical protein SARC_15604 [Sphaeroforma arctica JP610]